MWVGFMSILVVLGIMGWYVLYFPEIGLWTKKIRKTIYDWVGFNFTVKVSFFRWSNFKVYQKSKHLKMNHFTVKQTHPKTKIFYF